MPMSSRVNKDINIMIRGIGGQGVKLAGTIIGQAAVYDGRDAAQSMKYGSAITGGETRSEIKVSTERILYPKVTTIDVYVALTQEDLENYFDATIYMAAQNVAKKIPDKIKDKIILAPMIEIAEKIGNTQVANLVLIGILAQLFNIATPDSIIKAIKQLLPSKYHEANIQALKEGFSLDLSEYNTADVLELAKVCEIACERD
ncbi:MAG: 2-oxoacid:acceptor oxidoreductase family protein [Asgard group archaeon]|nr:2-oxoacid:acceptor oxidoreductase family protein [Asgard group archaeon]